MFETCRKTMFCVAALAAMLVGAVPGGEDAPVLTPDGLRALLNDPAREAERRAALENGPPPLLFAIRAPGGDGVVYVQGVTDIYSPALYPWSPRVDAALDDVERLVIRAPVPAPDAGDADDAPAIPHVDDGADDDDDADDEDDVPPAYALLAGLWDMLEKAVPAAAIRLPDGGRLRDLLAEDERAQWDGAVHWLNEAYPFLGAQTMREGLEHCPPVFLVGMLETTVEINLNSRDPAAVRLDMALLNVARERDIPVAQWMRQLNRLSAPTLGRLALARMDATTPDAQKRDLLRVLGYIHSAIKDDDGIDPITNAVTTAAMKEYTAFFARDRDWLPADPDWAGFLRTRIRSEWMRQREVAQLAGHFADVLAAGRRELWTVPAEYLTNEAVALPAACVAQGWLVEPVGADQ